MAMQCGLCKKPIRGDENYVIDHYKCSAELTQSFHDDIRAAFRAGFMAHPEAEAPRFTWSFDSKTCVAADKEPSAWEAYESGKAVGAVVTQGADHHELTTRD